MNPLRRGYIPEFDGLRALAATAVVLGHSAGAESFIKFTKAPGIAVRFFFVLSGFLITSILLGMRSRVDRKVSSPGEELKIFYIRRCLRIFPPYYAFLLFFLLIGTPFVVDTFAWHAAYLSNVYPAFHGNLQTPVAHFWTLAVEEQFYLFWPLLVMLVPTRRLKSVLVTIILTAFAYRLITAGIGYGKEVRGMLTIACLDALGIGSLLAVLLQEGTESSQRVVLKLRQVGLWIGLPALLASVIVAHPNVGFSNVYSTIGQLAVGVFSAAVLIGFTSHSDKPVARLLRCRPMRYLGQISYGIYIYHLPFLTVADGLTKSGWLPEERILRFPFVFASTLIVASLSWFLLERPCCSLKRFFQPKKDGEVTQPALVDGVVRSAHSPSAGTLV